MFSDFTKDAWRMGKGMEICTEDEKREGYETEDVSRTQDMDRGRL